MTILKLANSRSARLLGSLCMAGALTACIQVRAPDKPIEINLNVKVQQEVVVRLQQDAKDLIKNNPELFPQ
jgi:hypothetical protein